MQKKIVKKIAQISSNQIFTTFFHTEKISKQQKSSIQITARELRYNWFQELVLEHRFDYILTAHHLNDSNISDSGTLITLGSNTSVTGTLSATLDIIAYASSDERLKDNIKPIENPLQKINSIPFPAGSLKNICSVLFQ